MRARRSLWALGSRRAVRRRVRSPWRQVAILALAAAALVGGREWATAAWSSATGSQSCSIGRVVDGDTVKVWCPDKGMFSARLLGLDTPEVSSPRCISEYLRGTRATWSLRKRIWLADDVRMVFGGLDRYGRRLTRLYLDGRDVAHAMIAAGLARPYDGGRRRSWCR